MTAVARQEEEVSLFALATILLRNRWRIFRWMLAGGLLAVLLVLFSPPKYVASASFIPQGTDISRSGLANLAGQFGLSLPTGNQTLSPDFYARLLTSRTLLRGVARDTLSVPEIGRRGVPFDSLFGIDEGSPAQRDERAVRQLLKMVSVSVGKSTGIVELSVATKWPSASLGIATALLNGLDEFNQRTRQSQAAAERRFVESRLAVARSDLRAAEDRLQNFLQTNREFGRSPELIFERDRLQRDVSLQQQVFTSLTQSLEEVRIREVRDTPVITVVEPPSVQGFPQSQKRILHILFGLFLGAFVGALLSFASEAVHRRKKEGDVEVEEFTDTLGEVKGRMMGPVRTLRERIRS